MAKKREPPPSYATQLRADLERLGGEFHALIDGSTILNIDPNRGSSGAGVAFIGFPSWGWGTSDSAATNLRMALLDRIDDLRTRLELLFPSATPELTKAHKEAWRLLDGWARRAKSDHSVPSTVARAHEKVDIEIAALTRSLDLLPVDDHAIRLTVDTNALIDNPDLAAYREELGPQYRVHLGPTVLGELDDLKRSGRTPELRAAASTALRRLKGLRDSGDVRAGVTVVGQVTCVFDHVEPRGIGLPGWLDLAVPDDRLAASALLLQSAHPGSMLFVATSDISLQTKLAALGLPWVEPPEDKG